MSSPQPAFGAMLQELIKLGVVAINTEPLDAAVERRLKEFWENTSCPRYGHQSIVTWESTDRIWCRDCNFKPVFTYGTPFHEKHLACGEVLLAFTLYADTLLSINQIAPFLGRAYRTVHAAIRDVEAAVQRGFPVVWSLLDQLSMDRHKSTNLAKSARATKAKSRRGTAVLAAARPRQVAHAGEGVTVIS